MEKKNDFFPGGDFRSGHTLLDARHRSDWLRRYVGLYGFLYFSNGGGELESAGNRMTVEAGDALLLSPGMTQRFHTGPEGWEIWWFHFLPDPFFSDSLNWPETIPGVGRVTLPRHPWFEGMLAEAQELEWRRPPRWFAAARGLVVAALCFARHRIELENSGGDRRIATAQKLLISHPDWPLDEVARKCSLSRAVFFDRFRAECGVSPHRYRELRQLRKGAELLENTNLPVGRIAVECGLPGGYYFSTRFKSQFGLSPLQYRKKLLE